MKRVAVFIALVVAIFFSDISLCSTHSIVNNSHNNQVQQLRDLQLSMDGLWIEMMSGDEVGYRAYIAFLDAAGSNAPIVTPEVMRKLSDHDLAYQLDEDSEILFHSFKLELWDKHGTLGDNMKPRIKGLR